MFQVLGVQERAEQMKTSPSGEPDNHSVEWKVWLPESPRIPRAAGSAPLVSPL